MIAKPRATTLEMMYDQSMGHDSEVSTVGKFGRLRYVEVVAGFNGLTDFQDVT